MKATEVLNRYANGERNFRRANLRGQSFKGQDLSEADFTEADIRGANFTNAVLRGVNFNGALGGVQKRWMVIQLTFSLIPLVIISFFVGCTNAYFIAFVFSVAINMPLLVGVITYFGIVTFINVISTFSVVRYGLTVKAVMIVAIGYAIVTAVAGTILGSVFVISNISPLAHVNVTVGIVAGAIVGAIVGAIFGTLLGIGAGAGVIAGTITYATVYTATNAFSITFAFAYFSAVAGAVVGTGIGTGIGSDIGTYFISLIGSTAGPNVLNVDCIIYIASIYATAIAATNSTIHIRTAWFALRNNEKFALVRSLGIAFGAIGGTRFYGADLVQAKFIHATLKSTNFREANLTHACWQDTKQLDRALLGDSILSSSAIRELLVTRNGYKKSYVNANLRGANLDGINLNQANLKWADLSGATLQQTKLHDANLREVLAVGANFTRSSLTGVCLESWNIDYTTTLKEIDCQYVFLLEHPNELGGRERRPHEPDQIFAPGDFERLYTKMINVVQVLLRNGMNRTAFAEAFQQLMNEHPEISYESIQAVERKGNDALVTLEVSETTDKAKVSRSLRESYESKVRQLEAKVETLHKLRAADLKEVALAQKAQFFNQLVGGNAMQESTDQSRNINVTGNLNATGSTINLGAISGSVSNVVNQLPSAPDSTQPGIKELLVELQAAIENDAALSTEDKADALEQVKVFAELGQNPQQPEKEGLGRKAVKMLKGTIASLPDTAKLAEAVSKLLPLITKALGLPF